jgi:hypothetical protein
MSDEDRYQPLPIPTSVGAGGQQQQQQGTSAPAPGTSWPRTWQDAAGWQARDPIVAGSLTGRLDYQWRLEGGAYMGLFVTFRR